MISLLERCLPLPGPKIANLAFRATTTGQFVCLLGVAAAIIFGGVTGPSIDCLSEKIFPSPASISTYCWTQDVFTRYLFSPQPLLFQPRFLPLPSSGKGKEAAASFLFQPRFRPFYPAGREKRP